VNEIEGPSDTSGQRNLEIIQACGSELSTTYHMGRMTARKRYFTCPPSRGAFVRPDRVIMGDFPPENLETDEDEEI